MAGDVQREGSREGQGLHCVGQGGYFWCYMHIVFVPVFRLFCLRDSFGLLCSPSLQMSQGQDHGGRAASM